MMELFFVEQKHTEQQEKKWKDVLQSIQNISMIEQERYLNEFLNRWIGDNDQSDDILIIGIRA